MDERGVVISGVICITSLILVMIMAVNLRVNELEEDIKFLRGCVVELDMALEDKEFEAWMSNPVDEDDPFVIIN